MLLHTDFVAGRLVLIKDERPKARRLEPQPAKPDEIVAARCVKRDEDPRYWWVTVDKNGRRSVRRVRLLEDVVGLPGANITVKDDPQE